MTTVSIPLKSREAQAIRNNAISLLERAHRSKVRAINDRLHAIDIGIRECRSKISVTNARLISGAQYFTTMVDLKDRISALREEGDKLIAQRNELNRHFDRTVCLLNEEDYDV